MNKKLIAQFIASVNVSELPTSAFKSNELGEHEIREVIEQSVAYKYNGKTIYIIPNIKYGKYVLDGYIMENGELKPSNYIPSWKELSDILEEQKWNGDWVRISRIEKAMKYIDWNE